MQNQILGFFIVTCVSLGALCGVQWRQMQDKKLEAAQLRQQVASQTVELDGQIAAVQTLRREQTRLSQTLGSLNTQIRALQQTTNRLHHELNSILKLDWVQPGHTNNPLTPLLDTLPQDPSFQAWFQSQQQAFLARLFGAETDENIKTLLGEERFALYQAYGRTIGDRLFLEPFRSQLKNGPHPLQDQQFSQLLTLLHDERQELPPLPQVTPPDPLATSGPLNPPNHSNALLCRQEELNRRVLDRSRDFLLPDQLQALAHAQSNQIQIQKTVLELAGKLTDSNSAETPAQGSAPKP